MNIQYEIIRFYPQTGSVEVRYFCDEHQSGLIYNIDIPVVNGQYASKEEIASLIEQMKPSGQLQRLVDLQAAQVPSSLAALSDEAVAPHAMTADGVRGVRNVMLSASDWSQLPDAPLDEVAKAAWVEYRQLLRDVPEQDGFPESVIWPVSPDEELR
jgi:hypothetical protein